MRREKGDRGKGEEEIGKQAADPPMRSSEQEDVLKA